MKAKLEFNLPEENEEFSNAIRGVDYLCVLSAIREWFREVLKHNIEHMNETELQVVERCRDKFFQILDDYEIRKSVRL